MRLWVVELFTLLWKVTLDVNVSGLLSPWTGNSQISLGKAFALEELACRADYIIATGQAVMTHT